MIRKISILTLVIAILAMPITSLAATQEFGYFGTTSETSYLTPDGTNHDDYWVDLTVDGEGTGKVVWYGEGQDNQIGTSSVPGEVTAPDRAIFFQLVSTDGKEIYAVIAHSTNPNADTITFTKGDTSSGGDDGSSSGDDSGSGGSSDGGNQTCTITNSCDVFQCPEWATYMSKINQIASSMPEMPNWDTVAGTFANKIAPAVKSDMEEVVTNTLAPRLKSDMQDLFNNTMAPRLKEDTKDAINETLGKAGDLPSAPEMPTLQNDLDLSPPEGQEAEGLGDSTFTEDEIKDEALEIEEREDPTGGFVIDNPLESMPDVEVHEPAEQPAEAPIPQQEEPAAPTPKEDTAETPIPEEQPAAAPTPELEVPEAPPMPEIPEAEAPTPEVPEGEAPVPDSNDWSTPIPGNDDWQAPMPDDGGFDVPIPFQ